MKKFMLLSLLFLLFQTQTHNRLPVNEHGVYDIQNEKDLELFFEILNNITVETIVDDIINDKQNAPTASNTCWMILNVLNAGKNRELFKKFISPCRALYVNMVTGMEKVGRDYKRTAALFRKMGKDSSVEELKGRQLLTVAANIDRYIVPQCDRVAESGLHQPDQP